MNSNRPPVDELFRARMIIGSSPIGRHYADLAMAATGIGRLVAAGELDEAAARSALLDAAHPLIATKYCHCSRESVADTVDNAFAQAGVETRTIRVGSGDIPEAAITAGGNA